MARGRSVVNAPRKNFSGEKPFRIGEEISIFDASMVYAGRHPNPRFLTDGSIDQHMRFLRAGIPDQPRSNLRAEARLSTSILWELVDRVKKGRIDPKSVAYQQSGEIDPVRTMIRTRDLACLAAERGEKPRYLRHFQSYLQPQETRPPLQHHTALQAPSAAKHPRRGPAPGSVDRYGDSDRALYSEIDQIKREKQKSTYAAALELAYEGKVAGKGTKDNCARRLASRYSKDLRNSP
jgi:hypothetical protein